MRDSNAFLYQKIAESLRQRIASGELKPGDKLPPVRTLAHQWDCTPGTVSRAYAQLVQEGLVAGHRGSGTKVLPSPLQPQDPTWQWASLVNRAEQFLLEAIGSGHTPAQVEAALSVASARWRDLQHQNTSPPRTAPPTRLRFTGSHDLTVEILARMLADTKAEEGLSVTYLGSLGGLMTLARNEAEVAGIHLWDELSDTYNIPFVRRLLPGRRVALVTLAHRSLGLITPPENPQQLRCLADLSRSDVRLVNRQAGSGTRIWLDAQLKALAISPGSVSGYEREEVTHLAVARAVEEGTATVGLGIHAAASAYRLGFVPLTQERYDLAFRQDVWGTAVAQSLVTVVRSTRFKEAVAALGGYDTRETGQEVEVF